MKITQITENELPKIFADYWFSKDSLKRDWKFFLNDSGELFISEDDDDSSFITHWTMSGCCGVLNYIHDNKILPKNFGIICKCGCQLFTAEMTNIGIELKCSNCSSKEEFSW